MCQVDRERRPATARAVVVGGGVGDGLVGVAHQAFTRGRSTDSRPAAVRSSGTRTGGPHLVVIDDGVEHDDHDDDPDEQQRRDLAGPAVVGGRDGSSLTRVMSADREQAAVHEPGDEHGAA